MEKKSQDFSVQQAMKLAQSDAGQQLLALIRQQNGDAAQQAMDAASTGDYEAAKKQLSQLLSSPQIRALLNKLGNG